MAEHQECPICRGPIHGPRSFVVCPHCAVQLGGVSVGSGQVDPLARRFSRSSQLRWRPVVWCAVACMLVAAAACGLVAIAPWLNTRAHPGSDEVFQRARIFVRRYLETPEPVQFSDGVLVVPRGTDPREGFHSWGVSGYVTMPGGPQGPRREKFYAKLRYYPNERWTLELLRVGNQIAHEGGYVQRARRNVELNSVVDMPGAPPSRVSEEESGLRGEALAAWNRARSYVARGAGDVVPLRPLWRHAEADAWVFSFHVDRFHWKYGWNRRYVTCVIHAGPADMLRPVVLEYPGGNWVPITAPRGRPLAERGWTKSQG